jgi:predicted transcriptional regulator
MILATNPSYHIGVSQILHVLAARRGASKASHISKTLHISLNALQFNIEHHNVSKFITSNQQMSLKVS